MPDTSIYSTGTLIEARRRLWRVDAQDGETIHVTAVDDAQEQAQLYLPFETIRPGQISPPGDGYSLSSS